MWLDPDLLTISVNECSALGRGIPPMHAKSLHLVSVGASGGHPTIASLVHRFPVNSRPSSPAACTGQIRSEFPLQNSPRKSYFILFDIASAHRTQGRKIANRRIAVVSPYRTPTAVVIERCPDVAFVRP